MILRVVLFLALLTGASPAAAQQPSASVAAPGDVIRLVVWRVPEFSGDFPIAEDGSVLHPLLSEVRVTGMTREQLHARIAQVLGRFESEPRFVFSLLHRVAVTGEVRLPGLYPLPAETSIPQAIAAAGGPSQFASRGRVRLVRDGTATMLDLRRPETAGVDLRIRPGDRLEVPRQASLLRDIVVPIASVVGAVGAVITVTQN